LLRVLTRRQPAYTFRLPDRDEAGARALGDLRDRGINLVANALAQSAEHVDRFFQVLRTELAFCVGCLNLHERLAALSMPVCMPLPHPAGSRRLRGRGIYDPCLALEMQSAVVGNSLEADGKDLVIITGANQGGKSSFLRAMGVAQAMMQCGLFVAAESFEGDLSGEIVTHFKREEDATLKSGKLDEELARLSGIVDHLGPGATVLFNESFSATNEREGSEIARQVISALVERGVRVLFVTHLYAFARGAKEWAADRALFLRAERLPDGTRTFRLLEGEPLPTSHGRDLYERIFAATTPEG
jgi:DNA mismatch repair ATPase MutS